uniref:Uncharacterized protein n=1 Tax=Naja naja TaxID=35670 RepID=A0A8C6VLW8_NAJNA
ASSDGAPTTSEGKLSHWLIGLTLRKFLLSPRFSLWLGVGLEDLQDPFQLCYSILNIGTVLFYCAILLRIGLRRNFLRARPVKLATPTQSHDHLAMTTQLVVRAKNQQDLIQNL